MADTPGWKTALGAGIPFGLALGVVNGLRHGLASGVGSGVVLGAAFGVTIAWFASRQRGKLGVVGDSFEGAPILHQGPANHRRGLDSRGGWLVLTAKALHFRSHGLNLSNAPLDLPLTRVHGATPSNSLGILPNGLRVALDDGSSERFVVSDRNAWLDALTRARGAG